MTFARIKEARVKFDEHLPIDHRLSKVYRVGAGLMGLVLLAFGILGLLNEVGFFSTHGHNVAGLSSNGALSVLSIVVGILLFVGMVIGGNFASSLNMVFGVLFVLSGFINLAILDTSANYLAFRMPNILFSFVFGLVLMTFGMYGRVHSHLPPDNPYWRTRHPEQSKPQQAEGDKAEGGRTKGGRTKGGTFPPKVSPPAVGPG